MEGTDLMAKFSYKAMDAKGIEKKGAIDAESQNAAITQLREMGLFATDLVEAGAAAVKKDGKGAPAKAAGVRPGPKPAAGKARHVNLSALWGGSGVKTKVLTAFTRQLATLVDAGLPLLRGLNVLMKQEKNPVLKNCLVDLASAVESGSTFSEALFQHPKVFNKLYINMVKAGEVGGVLEVALNRLATFMEKAEQIKGRIRAAMFYPIAVLLIAGGILTFLMLKIIPQFETIFKEMLEGEKLPPFTNFILGISRAFATQIVWIILGLIVFIVGFKMFSRTKGGRLVIDTLLLKMPLLGDLIRKTAIARFTRTLGTLVTSGVPILQALLIVKEASGNRVVADAVAKVHDSVKEGESIVQPLEASNVFPPMVISMVDVGETTGALPDMLMKIADTYEEEVDRSVTGLVSLLEPLMIVFLAVVVGSIVIALFLPMIKIITVLGQSQ